MQRAIASPRWARTTAAVSLALATLACNTEPLTEIVVASDTDLGVPAELDTIRIRVHGGDRTEQAIAAIGDGAPRPVTLGVVSSSGQGTIEVAVIGELAGAEVLRRDARVAFVSDQVRVLRMDLLRSCLASACGDGMTCGESGCRPIDVGPEELAAWTGEVPALDGGARDDAGPGEDAGPGADGGPAVDGGPRDGGPRDGGLPPDAGPDGGPGIDGGPVECTRAADCDDGVPCTVDSCEGNACVHAPEDAMCTDAIACTVGSCDPTAGCVQSPDSSLCDDGIACTTDACDVLAGCRATPVHTTCASGSYCDPLADCTVAPTFTEVYASVISARCGPCHTTSGSPGGGLSMSTQTAAYLNLVGVGATCGTGNVRVIARDSSHSLLWRKVSGIDLCGDLMPRMSMTLTAAQISLIARWIDGGALDL